MTWNNGETLSRDAITTLSNNQDWLKANITPVRMQGLAGQRDSNNRILAGTSWWGGTATSSVFQIVVGFGSYFSPDCQPIITTTIRSVGEDRLFHRTYALDGSHAINSQGCIVAGYAYTNQGWDKNTVSALFVDWIAVGY
jgi:hypothetical protein